MNRVNPAGGQRGEGGRQLRQRGAVWLLAVWPGIGERVLGHEPRSVRRKIESTSYEQYSVFKEKAWRHNERVFDEDSN